MKKLLLTLSLITLIIQANAQWNGDPTANNAIVTTSNTTAKTGLVSINDGSNNMIIAWVDFRNSATSGTDIYVQKINNDGSLPWGAEKLVCNAANAQNSISMVSDGAGGAILAWGDKRSANTTNDEEVYGQRVKADGTMGWTANGIILTKAAASSSIYRRDPVLAKVSETEFMVVFAQLGTSADYFAQKGLISTGAPQWATDISIHGAQTGLQTGVATLPDGTGGAFVVWQDPRIANNNADLYGQRINNAGTLAWTTTGVVICDASGSQSGPMIVSDGASGFVVTWQDFRSLDNDIYAQRVDASGTRLWDVGTDPIVDLNGVGVCVLTSTENALKNQGNPKVFNDGSNNFIIAWIDPRTDGNSFDIYAQKLNNLGAIQWTANGVPVIVKENVQGAGGDFTIDSAGSGDVFVTYRDAIPATTVAPIVGSHNDIYIQRLNSADGGITTPFVAAGLPVSTNDGSISAINTIVDGSGGLIVAWQDSRTSTNGEIYASNVKADGTLPVTYKSVTASLTASEIVLVKWEIASEIKTKSYVVERAGEDGIFVAIGGVNANQLSAYQFIDENPIAGNSYYRIKSVDSDGLVSFSKTASVKIASLTKTTVSVYPNPVVDVLNVAVSQNNAINSYTLKLYDTNGQLKLSKTASAINGVLSVAVNGLITGVYTLQLADAKNNIITTKKVIKL